ncbi:hypothetical protein WT10_18960 [Burkholderia stagnalis]|nr:hypothetical protein WS59_19200 [Burkholderia stagnalis]KVN18869.1 hypothetical protein WT10_18960 [Burkholderia stagnalis]KVN39380.1 hypothetical protein WT11_03100 [Burkholderia stagnalis]KVX55786.1 hypothetical protein WT33_25495 [Burkholderia stagnalis]KWI68626.1 hypothetical protein WT75_21040 [Burkholderia stagnalis]
MTKQLGRSQPTVSTWLGHLREYPHDPLFTRTPGGMAPTPQAGALVGHAGKFSNPFSPAHL